MTAYARLRFAVEPPGFVSDLKAIPGVKRQKFGWDVPYNAINIVEGVRERYGTKVLHAAWSRRPQPDVTWEEVEENLRDGDEVRADAVLDGFLTPYQKEGIAFGWSKVGCHYWWPTGSGKTCIAILTALSSSGPILVVTRAASRVQYAREIERFLNLRAFVLRPQSSLKKHSVKLEDYLEECASHDKRPVVVAGWESLVDNLERILGEVNPSVFVADESHRGKGSKRYEVLQLPDAPIDASPEDIVDFYADQEREVQSKNGFIKTTEDGRRGFIPVMNTAVAAATISRSVQKRILTTATPIADRVRDLWSQLDLGEPNAWGNKTAWHKRYADAKPGKYGGIDTRGSSNLDELKGRIDGVVHILSYEVTHAQLPPKRRQSVYLTAEDQCKPLGGFTDELKRAVLQGPGAILEVRIAEAASRKRKAVLAMIKDHTDSGHKVVVFTGRKRDCDKLGVDVANHLKTVKVWAAHGDHNVEARQKIVDDYMSHPGPCVLVGTNYSFGESINLDDTDAAFMVMLPYTPGMLRQNEGRFHRLSTKRPVIIYYVIAEGTVDEHIAQLIIDKLPAVGEVVEDRELAGASGVLAGVSDNPDDLAKSVLEKLDLEDD